MRDLEAESGEEARVGSLDQAPDDLLSKPLHPGRDFWQDGPEFLLKPCDESACPGACQRAWRQRAWRLTQRMPLRGVV